MTIEIYALCHNEALMLPYFMRHYNQYGQVHLYEGHSTDGSAELARSLGANIVPYDTGDECRDDLFINMKNFCWTNSQADWVMIVDIDEFIYHPYLIDYLEKSKDTIIAPQNYNMFSDTFPTTEGQIYEEVQWGSECVIPTSSKMSLFRPREITNIYYEPGAHVAHPEGNVKINYNSEVIQLHMKWLSVDYIIKRNAYYRSRMSEQNIKYGWGYHVNDGYKEVKAYFDEMKPQLIKVI